MDPLLLARFPALAQVEDPAGRSVLTQARLLNLAAGEPVFRLGDRCENYLLVVAGRVKVLARSRSGREIILYRIEDTGSCVLTTSCLLGHDCYPAEGITETEVKAFAIPRPLFDQALQQSAALRTFIFSAYSERLSALISLVQEVAFERIDQRLARYLLEHGRSRQQLHCTHQQLATELGSAREVISRQLKNFEQQGWIQLGRGTIRIDQLHPLQQLADRDNN